ncbi:MAG: HAD family hydrolase [Ruminococcaceae bacterium]|nr:HAD family hydrolase [Oscillospiraceae bacterium]
MKKKYTHVIWDFNGTILNDMQVGIDCINIMLSDRGLPVLPDLEAYRKVFDFPVEAYYQRVGFDFEKEDYKTCLAPLWVSLYEQHSKNARLFSGVEPLTRALREGGIAQSILSASQSQMMRKQLRERGALEWFDEIWGNDSIHAYGKSGLAAAWRAAHPEAVAVMLGDTVHDFTVAREIGADCILIAAGHHSKERLLECGTPVVETLLDCLPFLLHT